MDVEKANFIKMTTGAMATALVFLLACAFVFVYLPEDGSNTVQAASVSATETSVALSPLSEEEIVADSKDFEIAETDVSGEIDFGDYGFGDIIGGDKVLSFYRNAQSRVAVEVFYSDVTGDRDIALAILDAASRFNMSPSLAFAVAYAESRYNVGAEHTNLNGSVDRGLFQLNSYSFPNLTEDQFFDAETSAYYGISHLDYCLETAGNEVKGLAMYNAGRNKVQDNKTPERTLDYINIIMNYKNSLDSKFASEVLAYYSDGIGNGNTHYLAKY